MRAIRAFWQFLKAGWCMHAHYREHWISFTPDGRTHYKCSECDRVWND